MRQQTKELIETLKTIREKEDIENPSVDLNRFIVRIGQSAKYSKNNLLLAFAQNKTAETLLSVKRWNEKGMRVLKGMKSKVRILLPRTFVKKEDGKDVTIRYYTCGFLFDETQVVPVTTKKSA